MTQPTPISQNIPSEYHNSHNQIPAIIQMTQTASYRSDTLHGVHDSQSQKPSYDQPTFPATPVQSYGSSHINSLSPVETETRTTGINNNPARIPEVTKPPTPEVQAQSPVQEKSPLSSMPLDNFELAKYLIKCAILDYRFQHPKTVSTKCTISTATAFDSHISQSQSANPPSHQINSHKRYSSMPNNISLHTRKPSGSSLNSVNSSTSSNSVSSQTSFQSALTRVETFGFQDPFQVLLKAKTSKSKLFPKFTEKLRPKLHQDLSSTRQFTNPQFRRMLDLFLDELDDSTIGRLDRDARVEGVLILFITCASKTLKKMGGNNVDIPKEISSHTNNFLNYLMKYVKKSTRGLISSSRSALLNDLENYSESFAKNSRLEPQKTIFTPETQHLNKQTNFQNSSLSSRRKSIALGFDSLKPTVSSASTLYPTKSTSPKPTSAGPSTVTVTKNIRNNDLSVDFDNPKIVYIADMLEISKELIPDLVGELFATSTDTAALNDLRKCNEDTHAGCHPCYTSDLFLTIDDYFKWSASEFKKLDTDIKFIKDKAPYLNEERQIEASELSSIGYSYLPPSPVKNFHNLALYLLEYEYNTHYASKEENSSAQGGVVSFDFSSDAHAILRFVEMFWRVNSTTMGVILLLEAKRLQDGGLFTHDFLVDSVYPFIISYYLEPNRNDIQSWTRYEKAVSYKSMSNALKDMLKNSVQKITIDDYGSTIATFQKLNSNITSYIQPYSRFDGLPPLTVPEDLELSFRQRIGALVTQKFNEQASTHYPDTFAFHLKQFSKFVRVVYDTIRDFKSSFKSPLFGFNICKMMINSYLHNFFIFSNKLIPIIPLDLELETGERFETEDIRVLVDIFSSIVIAYEKVSERNHNNLQSYIGNVPMNDLVAAMSFDELRLGLNPSLKAKFKSEVDAKLSVINKDLMNEDFDSLISSKLSPDKSNMQELMSLTGLSSFIESERNLKDSVSDTNYLNITNSIHKAFAMFLDNFDTIECLGFPLDTSADLSLTVMSAISHSLCQYSNRLDTLVKEDHQNNKAIQINNLYYSLKSLSEFNAGLEEINFILHEGNDNFSYMYQPKTTIFEINIRYGRYISFSNSKKCLDTYVVLKCKNQVIAQSKTVYNTQNPVWNKMLEVTQKSDKQIVDLELTVWGKYEESEDFVCGRQNIHLNPKAFSINQPASLWVALDNDSKVLLEVMMTSEQNDNIVYQYNKCLKQLHHSYKLVIGHVVSNFVPVIRNYISEPAMAFFFQQRALTETKSFTENEIAVILDPLFEYLDKNLRLFWKTLIPNAMDSVLMGIWNVCLDVLFSIALPETLQANTNELDHSCTKNSHFKASQPLNPEQCRYILTAAKMLLSYCNCNGKGVSRDVLSTVPKYEFLVRLLSSEYNLPDENIEGFCNDRRSEMVRIKSLYQTDFQSQEQVRSNDSIRKSGLMASRNLTPFTVGQLERQESRYGQAFYLNEMELVYYLKLLRLRGENQFVKNMLMSIN